MKERELTNTDKTIIVDRESLRQPDQRHPYLVIYIGHDTGHRHKLHRGTMTIGRSSQADITIEDDRISRIHCIIEWMGNTIRIDDQGSTNGIYVDSQAVNHAILSNGVPIQLGHSIMKIEYKTEAEIQAEENLLYKASFDSLTGIFNRHHFIKLAFMEIAYASRHKLPVGVIMIDIDDFKQVNDQYGHLVGDTVLSQFSNIVIENKRTEDLFARYGGEEFIIMPRGEVNKKLINNQCERIRKAIEAFDFCFDETRVRITASFGFYLIRVESVDIEKVLQNLIRQADEGLYLAKNQGKNRTESLL
jgi:two-component system cell cycle response regulator